MTSKEWVKNELSYTDDHYTTYERIMLNNILKDLERLEEINKVWHDNEPMESVDINGKHLQELYDFNSKLINENEVFKEKGKELIKDCYKAIDIAKKYKKAIEILKVKRVDIVFFKACGSLKEYNLYKMPEYKLTQQEYELLKEVLGK